MNDLKFNAHTVGGVPRRVHGILLEELLVLTVAGAVVPVAPRSASLWRVI